MNLLDRAYNCFFLSLYYCCTSTWFYYLWKDADWKQQALQCSYNVQEMPFSIALFYCVQFSFYLVQLYDIYHNSKDQSNYVIMTLHHVVTLILIGFSLFFDQEFVGMYILGLHDVGDVFLYLSDGLNKYSRFHNGKHAGWINYTKITVFVLFTILFVYCRLYLFGIHVIGACYQHLHVHNHVTLVLFGSLVLLLCMHVFWLKQIVFMLYRLWKQGTNAKDVRE